MNDQKNVIYLAESYLRESVAPLATAIDSDTQAVGIALKGLGERSLLALQIPKIWGGGEVSEEIYRCFQEMVARYCGALAFLQQQHQSAALMLLSSDNSELKQKYLPYMGNGQILLGVGFSQLRRQAPQSVEAYPVGGGYRLDGEVPWVTGWGLFQEFIVAALMADGKAVFGIVPLENTTQSTGGTIALSPPMPLSAFASTNTVSARLQEWFIPHELVLFVKPPSWIQQSDQKNVLNPAFLALGCARAGLDVVEIALLQRQLPFLKEAYDALNQELTECRSLIFTEQVHPTKTVTEKIQLRAWAINLTVRCAHAAVTVSGGAANLSNNVASRVYREALVFTVTAQTTAVMAATLERLKCR